MALIIMRVDAEYLIECNSVQVTGDINYYTSRYTVKEMCKSIREIILSNSM